MQRLHLGFRTVGCLRVSSGARASISCCKANRTHASSWSFTQTLTFKSDKPHLTDSLRSSSSEGRKIADGILRRVSSDLNARPKTPGERQIVYSVVKRLIDIAVSLSGLIVLAPVFLLIALLIKLDSPGPIFISVTAWRHRGKTFPEWKFRTMRNDADSALNNDPDLRAEFLKKFKLRNDPRVTRLGRVLRKTSLNELPQLFNVLVGQMSLVGPRPIAIDERERYGPLWEIMLRAPSGMTGLWQVSGRQDTSYEVRVALDMYYIEHRSLWLDLAILGRTLRAVTTAKGAY